MDPIATLMLMFMAKQSGAAAAQKKRKGRAPAWPTPTSPPPLPAFQPAPTTDTATPLADLHAQPPQVAPANTDVKAATKAPRRPRVPRIIPGVLQSTVPVLRLQQALNARGANLVPDGLYGPKTAAAWMTMASSKALPPSIARVGPKVAKVVTHTFDALTLPAIP